MNWFGQPHGGRKSLEKMKHGKGIKYIQLGVPVQVPLIFICGQLGHMIGSLT